MRRILLILLLISLPALALGPDSNQRFNQLVDEYFTTESHFHPADATQNGFHEYDHQLEDMSAAAVRQEADYLHRFLPRLQALHDLTPDNQIDREFLESSVRADLLGLEVTRGWQTNPSSYDNLVVNSAYVLMNRNYAPLEQRLAALIDRERAMPAVFEAAHRNLRHPPHIFTEIALEQLPDEISFMQHDVPSAFASVKDATLQARFARTNARVVNALQQYQQWLKTNVLPRSDGNFRLGADVFRKKLLYEEMCDIPLDRLLAVGEENLKHNQQWFAETAKKLDPTRTPQQILESLEKDHPAPDKLLGAFTEKLQGLKDYIQTNNILTIPSPVLPIVEETPPFMRALTFASMDIPGPYENVAQEAYLNVTLPESDWKPQRVEEHMEGFNYGTITSTAIHEAYPGHYVDFLWGKHLTSKVRKLLYCGSNSEGWAHYCEQMMLDAGYGQGDLKLRLGQLQDALLRNARFIVAIKMHTGTMTLDQAVDFFVKEGYQTRANGLVEAKRGTSDATYLVYTLGKLEIMKLREDSHLPLSEFHNKFLACGGLPLPLIRRILLGHNSPAL